MFRWQRKIFKIGGSKALTLPAPVARNIDDDNVIVYSDGVITIIVPSNAKLRKKHKEILKILAEG